MSDSIITIPARSSEYELDDDLLRVMRKRRAEGQRVYGKGKQNAAYKRDNLADVIEELADAFIILGFFEERFAKQYDPLDIYDVNSGVMVTEIRNGVLDALARAYKLRRRVWELTDEKGVDRIEAIDPPDED
jgi:hypothetical protein